MERVRLLDRDSITAAIVKIDNILAQGFPDIDPEASMSEATRALLAERLKTLDFYRDALLIVLGFKEPVIELPGDFRLELTGNTTGLNSDTHNKSQALRESGLMPPGVLPTGGHR